MPAISISLITLEVSYKSILIRQIILSTFFHILGKEKIGYDIGKTRRQTYFFILFFDINSHLIVVDTSINYALPTHVLFLALEHLES